MQEEKKFQERGGTVLGIVGMGKGSKKNNFGESLLSAGVLRTVGEKRTVGGGKKWSLPR